MIKIQKEKTMKAFSSFFALFCRHKKTLLLIFVVSTATTLISSAIAIWLSNFHNMTLPTIGTIRTIGVEAYWDTNLENRTETIDWGTISPGVTKNVTLYIRSVSNVKTTLHIFESDVSPSKISNYLDLSWDYDGALLDPGEIIPVTLFLSASPSKNFMYYLVDSNVKTFSINIHLVAEE